MEEQPNFYEAYENARQGETSASNDATGNEVENTQDDVNDDATSTEKQEEGEEPASSQEKDLEEFEYANERSQQIDEWLRANPELDIQEAMFWNDMVVDELDDDDVMYMGLSEQNPDKSDERVELMFENLQEKYGVLYQDEEEIQAMIEDPENPLTENKYRELYLEHEEMMDGFKKTLSDQKEKLALDLTPKESEPQGLSEEQIQSYYNAVDENTKDFSEMQIEFGEGQTATFKVDDEMRNAITETMKNPDKFWMNYVDKDGQTNFAKLREDMLWLARKDEILKTLTNQAKTVATEEQIKKDANIKFDKKPSSAAPKTESLYDAYEKARSSKLG